MLRYKYATKQTEQDAAFIVEFYSYLSDFYHARISAQDYAYFMQNYEKFNNLWQKYIGNNGLDLLNPLFDKYKKYYEVNLKRNEIWMYGILLRCLCPTLPG